MPDQPIRLGIVRCDSHAYWYAPFLDEVDPEVLSSYSKDAPTRQSVHYYACTVGHYRTMAVEPVPGFVISKVFDRVGDRAIDNPDPEALQYGSYPGRAQAFCETLRSRPKLCHTIDEMSTDIDAIFIADSSSPGDGADHLALARPFLQRGIPCFVDKPFASTLTDAREMVRLAQEHRTVVMTASLLQYTETLAFFRRRFDEIGAPGLLTIKGVGYHNAAAIHSIAIAHGLFGYGVESVECMGLSPKHLAGHWNRANTDHCLEHLLLHYADGRQALIMNTRPDWCPRTSEYFCSAYSNQGALHSPGIGDREFMSAGPKVVRLFQQMIRTDQPPIPYEQMLEPVVIIEAARIAQRDGLRVRLEDVLSQEAAQPCIADSRPGVSHD